MINLRKLSGSGVLGLSLQKSVLEIKQTIADVILIEDSLEIIIDKNVDVILFDLTNSKKINVRIGEGSNVKYQILNSSNTDRAFKNYGNLEITEISLGSSLEHLDIDVLNPNSNTNVELLAVGNKYNQSFYQQINHQAKSTNSNISNFGVALNGSNILFDTTGKIFKGMAKSVCKQLSKGIIMDDDSLVTSRPILLIDEYDVIANHGASIGKMSDDSLFYLMSRGLSRTEAFLLILEGIISPFIAKIAVKEYQEEIDFKLKSFIKR